MDTSTHLRLVLRPGTRGVRSGPGELQVGLDAPHRVVLPDTPDVRRLLDDLAGHGVTRPPPALEPALRALEAAGLLLEARDADRHRDLAATPAAYARHGRAATARLEGRATATIGLLVDPDHDVTGLVDLLARSGVRRVVPGAAGDVVLVAAAGLVSRDRVDPLLREGTPHLLLEGRPAGLRVGPFVVPGRTACLRCVDAHESETDPRRSLVLEQLADDPAAAVTPDPVEQVWAWATIAHDLLAWVDGEQPSTWSTTLVLGGPMTPVTRHPHCGCAWDFLSCAG